MSNDEIVKLLNQHRNKICFFADPDQNNGQVLKGGSVVTGDIDIIGNYIVSTLIKDENLYSIFRMIMDNVETERKKSLKSQTNG
jgi:hypothetical protein